MIEGVIMYPEKYKIDNINRVLEEALILCEELGIQTVTNKLLAQRVKLSSKSIQRYFENKTDMIYQISEKVKERNRTEINNRIKIANLREMRGSEQISTFLKIHNRYVLENYKDVLFMQSAYIYCRYAGEKDAEYLQKFRSSEGIREALEMILHRGYKDKSIDESHVSEYFTKSVSIICAALLERLAEEIDTKILTIEEAIKLSDDWIEHVLLQITY